jgi:hypothetical protein
LELHRLKERFEMIGTPEYVIAKSVGTALTAMAIQAGLINPEKVVLMGFPIGWDKHPDLYGKLENIIKKTKFPPGTIIIQEDIDGFGGFKVIEETFRDFARKNNYTIHEIKGIKDKTHDYSYEKVSELINPYLNE